MKYIKNLKSFKEKYIPGIGTCNSMTPKMSKIFKGINNSWERSKIDGTLLLGALCDCFEVSKEAGDELEILLEPYKGQKISDNDELVKKIFDIVITNNENADHKGPLNQASYTDIEQVKDFIKTNEGPYNT